MNYNNLTQRHFETVAHAGVLAGADVRRGAAGSWAQGTWVQFDVRLGVQSVSGGGMPAGPAAQEGQAAQQSLQTVQAVRFLAYGCPHVIAVADWIAEHGVGMETGLIAAAWLAAAAVGLSTAAGPAAAAIGAGERPAAGLGKAPGPPSAAGGRPTAGVGARPPAAALPESVSALQQRFGVPVEKRGRLLIIEDAWRAALSSPYLRQTA